MNLKDLSKPLAISDIDFRIQSINKGQFANVLAYKTARTDMDRLDEVVGPANWKREYKEVAGLLMCGVSIKCDGEWVTKWDTGTESNTEKEKGHVSDAFKRACVNWGLGRELYKLPQLSIKLNDDEVIKQGDRIKQSWKLNLNNWRWKVEWYEGICAYIGCNDESGKRRFEHFSLDVCKRKNVNTILQMKECFARDDLQGAGQLWYELDESEQFLLTRAESKGGPFTSQEREKMKTTAFREGGQ